MPSHWLYIFTIFGDTRAHIYIAMMKLYFICIEYFWWMEMGILLSQADRQHSYSMLNASTIAFAYMWMLKHRTNEHSLKTVNKFRFEYIRISLVSLNRPGRSTFKSKCQFFFFFFFNFVSSVFFCCCFTFYKIVTIVFAFGEIVRIVRIAITWKSLFTQIPKHKNKRALFSAAIWNSIQLVMCSEWSISITDFPYGTHTLT